MQAASLTNVKCQLLVSVRPGGVNLVQRLMSKLGVAPSFLLPASLPTTNLLAIFVLCVAATLIGPNFYHPYISVIEYSKAKFPYQMIIELQPLSFRGYGHLAELLIAAAGFYAVGWQKKLDAFKLALLAVDSELPLAKILTVDPRFRLIYRDQIATVYARR